MLGSILFSVAVDLTSPRNPLGLVIRLNALREDSEMKAKALPSG